MTFLAALLLVQLSGFWAMVRTVNVPSHGARYGTLGLYAIVVGSLVTSGTLFLVLADLNGNRHAGSYIPLSLLAGALVTAAGCSLVIAPTRQAGAQSPFDRTAIVVLLCCAYLAFTAVDHLRFFGDKERTGFLDSAIAAEAGIRCESGFVLIRIDPDNASVTYRCPHNIVLGNPLGEPFVPWPTYREGSSAELLHALRRLQSSADTGTTH